MSRTIKTDQPPLKMVIESGRLAPASAYDAERLDTYRRGATLNVFITHEQQRVDEKKWWAAVNRAVKECSTPWQKAAQASEAIKLALGIVNYSKTIGGEYMQYPKSLTELDDAELADAVRGLFDVLYGVTGVDPEEWKKQVAHIRDEEPSSAPTGDEGSDGLTSPDTGTVAADQPADEAEAGADDSEAADGQSASSAPELSEGDRAFLVRVFKTMRDCVGPSVEDFTRAALIFKEEIADKSLAVKAKARTIRLKLEECCGDDPKLGTVQAAKYLAGLIGVDEKDLA